MSYINSVGYAIFREHRYKSVEQFWKSQEIFKEWCRKNGHNYVGDNPSDFYIGNVTSKFVDGLCDEILAYYSSEERKHIKPPRIQTKQEQLCSVLGGLEKEPSENIYLRVSVDYDEKRDVIKVFLDMGFEDRSSDAYKCVSF